jgi:hypothetical protein
MKIKTNTMRKQGKVAFKSVSQYLIQTLTKNPNVKLEVLTVMVKKIKPKSKWATDKVSAEEQFRWYKSNIKSGRIKGVLSAKKAIKA